MPLVTYDQVRLYAPVIANKVAARIVHSASQKGETIVPGGVAITAISKGPYTTSDVPHDVDHYTG